mgnify:CR=1 FL=1|tara:strand:+ start:862 stop:1167 length:306 start_codon:yes stop_codon:yes gene_type:complete
MGQYYQPPSGSQINQFEKFGQPGRFTDPIVIAASSVVDFTGSNYGYGAFSLSDVTNVHITASNGALLEGSDFTAKEIYEIGLKRIEIGTSGRAIAYKLRGM